MELLSPDITLADRYQIRSLIGSGGMGAVYLARDMRLPDKQWAVKEIWNTYTNQKQREEASTSFSREAEILSRLDHPGIPRVEGYDTELAKPLTEEELKNPERRKAHLKAGMDYMRCNELDGIKCQNAVRIFEELAEKVPETEEGLEALRNLPFCYRRLKKTDKYLEARRKIINYGTEKSRASDHFDYGEALMEAGNSKEALKQYRLASEIASMKMDSNRFFPALCQYKYAACLEALGKNRESREAYARLTERFPGVGLPVTGKREMHKTETISREALERIPVR